VLRHKTRINGYEQPEQVAGIAGFQINFHLNGKERE
jgi:hypothetical protein